MFRKCASMYICIGHMLNKWLMPVLVLLMRLWMAKIWWYSGMSKRTDWNATLYLFQYEYKTPFLPYELSAYLATAFELVCPWLLIFGLATRVAVLPMLAMVAVIQLTYIHLEIHVYWAMLLGTILFFGPGYLSLDALIKKVMGKSHACPS